MKGIYRIKNNLTGKVYIGNTNSYEELKILKAGLHDNEMLQSDYNSFKENSFIVEPVIEDIPEHEDIEKITEEVVLHENPYYNKFSYKDKNDWLEIQTTHIATSLLRNSEKIGTVFTGFHPKKENSIFVTEVISQLKQIMKESNIRQSKIKGVPAPKMSKILNGSQSITLEDLEMIANNCNKKSKLIFE